METKLTSDKLVSEYKRLLNKQQNKKATPKEVARLVDLVDIWYATYYSTERALFDK